MNTRIKVSLTGLVFKELLFRARIQRVHSDNKGYAASLLENDKTEDRQFVAAFCSKAQADVYSQLSRSC